MMAYIHYICNSLHYTCDMKKAMHVFSNLVQFKHSNLMYEVYTNDSKHGL